MNITVIYIIYQIEVKKDFMYVLNSTLNQTSTPQIIVCEQNQKPTEWLKAYCVEHGVRYLEDSNPGDNAGNMGYLKNKCIKHVDTDYIYFSDTDIVLHQKNYLKRILNYMVHSHQDVIVRPPMLRLTCGKEHLFKALENNVFPDFKNPDKRCFIKFKNNVVQGESETYRFINNLPHVKRKGYSEWQLSYHSGGICASTRAVKTVGGYSMKYYLWGMDDIDLQWKLNEKYGARALNECLADLNVIHIEHESRMNSDRYRINKEIFRKRMESGLEESIKEDCEAYDQIS